ncbi:hypothetical protein O3M35_000240 [Rhynocoris fuscipes]|uniref:ARMC9 CTLH-like domain-containing protein n=1 Tax=Rhynocoris fuscipes TaxID=488301 RepID=A0AAW1DLP9_9HEMI
METLETHYQADVICFELIIEFFLYHNFQNTLIALRKEMEEFNYPWPDPLPRTKDRILKNHVPILLKLLDGYDHIRFFEKWSTLIPNEIKTHTEYKKLTIYLYTYFATLKYRDFTWDNNNENLEEYLEIDNQNDDETKSEDTVEEIKTVQKLDKTNGTFIIDRPSQITYLPIVEENISLEKPEEISPNEDSKNENDDSLNKEFDTDSLEENELDDMDSKDLVQTQNTENSAMDMFKSFLAENGAEFTNDPEFLPFYALPFVENPKSHPAFNKVFEENWRNELKQTVEQFLINFSCGNDVIPQLVQLYLNNESIANAKEKEDQSLSLIEENSKKLKDVKRKFHKLKKDYQKLIGVANELSSSLEKSVQGEAVNLKLTLSNCIKIFPDLFSLSVPAEV